jgi:6-phosphogluconolactonase (cycloisomerase 2 family)
MINKQRQGFGFHLAGIHPPRAVAVSCLLWAWLSCVPAGQAADPPNGNSFDVLVGTYTSGKSKGIYSFRFNAVTGDLQPLAAPAETVNPSYLVVSPDNKFVYAVNELHGCGNEQGAVSAFRFDAASGALTFIDKVSAVGDDPCYVSLSPDGQDVFVANYSSGNLSVLAVQPDGSLAGPVETLTHLGHGPNPERQKSAHVHMVIPSPDNEFLFATDLGEDRVYAYHCEPGSPMFPLHPAKPAFTVVTPGAGPRHLAFSHDGRFVYLIEEMGEAVVVFQRHKARLDPIQTVRVAAKEWPGDVGAAALHFSPDGKFLYASNRTNANDLVIYSVDEQTGTLTMVGHQASLGTKPRDFCIDPTGTFVVVANQDSDNLVIFKRDPETGALMPTGKSVEVGSPVCVQMVPAP